MKSRKTTAVVSAETRRWQAEDALRTITRAEELKQNSGLMRDVKKLVTEQQKMLTKATAKKA